MQLNQVAAVLAQFDTLDPKALPLHHAQVLVFIAQKGSCIFEEIENEFHLSNASVSRICGAFSDESNRRKQTLNLIEIFRDPAEARRYRVRLNARGHAFIHALTSTES